MPSLLADGPAQPHVIVGVLRFKMNGGGALVGGRVPLAQRQTHAAEQVVADCVAGVGLGRDQAQGSIGFPSLQGSVDLGERRGLNIARSQRSAGR